MIIFNSEGQAFFNWLSVGVRSRKLTTVLAIAKAIADMLVIPSSEVEDADATFQSMCLPDARCKLSPINEMVVVDTDTIIEYVRKFWKVRYYTMFPKFPLNSFDSRIALLSFFGLEYAIDQDTIKVITEDYIDLFKVYNNIHLILTNKEC